MKFDKSRFAKLAGLPQSRGTLNESRRRKALRRRAMLNEGMYPGSRAEMDQIDSFDPFDDDEIEMVRYDDDMGRGDNRMLSQQFNLDDLDGDDYAQMMYDDYLDGGVDDDDDDYPLYEGEEVEEEEVDEEDKDMVEIDDAELMKEVRNIKRKRINEARLKAVIEDELRDVLAEMQYGSDWMYGGSNKPTASKKGQVTRGFRGLGFK